MKKALAPIILFALILSSCNNDFGIMKSIQEEEKQKDGVFYKGVVTDIVKFGTDYYASMQGIWKRAAAGGAWSPVSGLPATTSWTGLAVANGTLYALHRDDGVYSYDGTTWAKLADPSFTGKNIDGIFSANNVLFLQDHDYGTDTTENTADDTYTLYSLNAGALAASGIGTLTATPFRGVAFDGASYWAIAGTSVYSGGAPSSLAASLESNRPQSVVATAIASDGTTLYIGRIDGSLYRRSGVNTWNTLTISSGSEITALALTTAGTPKLLVGLGGTEGSGYYEVDPALASSLSGGASGAILASSTNYDTTLSGLPITAFLADGSTLLVGAVASNSTRSGLYGNSYSSAWAGWTSE